MKHIDQRVAVFVDIQNLYFSSRVLFNKKVDYEGVLEGAVGNRKLIRAIGYGIATEEAHEDKFFDALEETGYEIKTKDLQIFSGGQKKGDWDVGITVDAIKIAPKVDVIVLISGDGDYIPLVEYLQSTTGCRVEGMAFGESTSIRLIETLDDFINLSDNKEKYTISQKKSNNINRRKNTVKNSSNSKKVNTNKGHISIEKITNIKQNNKSNIHPKQVNAVSKEDSKQKFITLSRLTTKNKELESKKGNEDVDKKIKIGAKKKVEKEQEKKISVNKNVVTKIKKIEKEELKKSNTKKTKKNTKKIKSTSKKDSESRILKKATKKEVVAKAEDKK